MVRGGSAMILIAKTGWGLEAHAARGAEGGEDRRGDRCDELCNKLNRFFLTHNFEI